MASRKLFSTMEELEAELQVMSEADGLSTYDTENIDIVQLPPDTVNVVTDEEDIDENELEDDNYRGFGAKLELHYMATAESEKLKQKICNRNPRGEKKKERNGTNNNKGKDLSKKRPRLKSDLGSKPKWEKVAPSYSKSFTSPSDKRSEEMINYLKEKTEVEIFELFFNEDLLNNIAEESIRYAHQNNRHIFHITPDCIRNFIGILIYSGYSPLPQEKLYWNEDFDIDRKCVRECMPRNRFQEIKRNLHFNNNDNTGRSEDKAFKIRPLYEKLNENFKRFGVFSPKLTIDEQMVRYFGHHYLKQFIKGKPIRFGLKQWILSCGETGYCFHMDLYLGKNTNIDIEQLSGLGERVVLQMVNLLHYPKKHEIYIDNFFTSYKLLKILNEKEVRCTGTVRYNRMAMKGYNFKSDQEMKKEIRGYYEYCFDTENEILALIWKDNNNVKMLSNHLKIEPVVKVKRYSREQKKAIDIEQPNLVSQYNKFMGGVDKLDWHIQKYRIKIRGKKWYTPLITNSIDVALYNAYVLYNMSHDKIPYLNFKRTIAKHYLQITSYSSPKNCGRPSGKSIQIAGLDKTHILQRTQNGRQRRCVVCKKNSRKQCKACDLGLHVNCLEQHLHMLR